MRTFQQYVDQMNRLLDELTQTATKLRDASLQVISEEELAPLQRQQEEILTKLETTDQEFQRHYGSEVKESVHQQFHQQLEKFQTLNEEFIANLNASHGLIQFELRRLKEGEESDKNLLDLTRTPFLTNLLQSDLEEEDGDPKGKNRKKK
jgi:CHAD domain-containing protein